jgi:hypothetical protein
MNSAFQKKKNSVHVTRHRTRKCAPAVTTDGASATILRGTYIMFEKIHNALDDVPPDTLSRIWYLDKLHINSRGAIMHRTCPV